MPYIIDLCRLLLLGSSQEFITKMEIKILNITVSLLRTIQIDDNMLNDIEIQWMYSTRVCNVRTIFSEVRCF